MRKIAIGLLVVFAMATTASVFAADTKVNGRLYAHWMMDLSDGADSFNDFGLSRAYVTVKSKLSDYTSVRITTDIRETGSFDGYTIILKYAYIDWKPAFGRGVAALRLGLQPTHYIDNMNSLWGRRYLEKTVGDLHSFLTTADLGAGLTINLGDEGRFGNIAGNIWNGTSYTDVEELNTNKDLSGFLILTPLAENDDLKRTALVGQVYFGTQNTEIGIDETASDWDRLLLSFGGMLGYRNTLDLGADVNLYSQGQGPDTEDLKESGFSFFAAIYLEDVVADESPLRTLNFFGRMDMYDPNTDVDDNGNTLFIGGIECVPVKGFRASVNLRTVSYQAEGADSETYLFLNTLFKF